MIQITFVVFALAAVCLGKSIDYAPAGKAVEVGVSVGSSHGYSHDSSISAPAIVEEVLPEASIVGAEPVETIVEAAAPLAPLAPLSAETVFNPAPSVAIEQGAVAIQEPLPVEEARPGLVAAGIQTQLEKEIVDYAAPSVSLSAPIIDLPKGAREVVDVPHAHIELPGNSLQNQNVHLNLPSPLVEAPRPIIRNKEVLFRLPQPVFYVPRPIVQHKPMVYRLGHTLRAITPIVSAQSYVFRVPQAQITGKSAYTQPIPAIGKSFH